MTRLLRLVLPTLPLVVGALLGSLPGRAQESSDARYAFADTTLLRDTLGIHFDRSLFRIADSLRLAPDTLRALSIRYRYAPARLVALSDSLHLPVDSVGVHLERERFNPLGLAAKAPTQFTYNTTYNVQKNRGTWMNASDYSVGFGPVTVRNSTNIQVDRSKTGDLTNLYLNRSSTTEGGWRVRPGVSIGGRAVLSRNRYDDAATVGNVGERRDEYQLALRTKHPSMQGLDAELNLFSGLLDLASSAQNKRGFSNNLDGRMRYAPRRWLSQELSGSLSGNVARSRFPDSARVLSTHDFLSNLRGGLHLNQSAPVELNSTFNYRNGRTETPTATGVQTIAQRGIDFDASLMMRRDNDRYVQLTQNVGSSHQATVLNGETARGLHGFAAEGRYALRGWSLEGRFSTDFTRLESPQVTDSGGYTQRVRVRALEGALSRPLMARLTARLSGRISLTSGRVDTLGGYRPSQVPNDVLQRTVRVEGTYQASHGLGSTVAFEVSRTELVNIPSSTSSANNVLRTYHADWRWTYALMPGLTVNQSNVLAANYTNYAFRPPQEDQLQLEYTTMTTLNAVLSPRLSMDLTHTSQTLPSGNYVPGPGDVRYFSPADERREFRLDGRITYGPSPAISFSFEPRYRASDRDGTLNGVQSPQRRDRSLYFVGAANLNLPVGPKGRLSGNIGRTYQGDRATSFANGTPQPNPRSQFDFWAGSLQFSWQL